MLENINLSYITQNHSSVTILKYFVLNRPIRFHNINTETSLTVKRSFKRDSIHYYCALLSDEPIHLITTSSFVLKLGYRTLQLYCDKQRKI